MLQRRYGGPGLRSPDVQSSLIRRDFSGLGGGGGPCIISNCTHSGLSTDDRRPPRVGGCWVQGRSCRTVEPVVALRPMQPSVLSQVGSAVISVSRQVHFLPQSAPPLLTGHLSPPKSWNLAARLIRTQIFNTIVCVDGGTSWGLLVLVSVLGK